MQQRKDDDFVLDARFANEQMLLDSVKLKRLMKESFLAKYFCVVGDATDSCLKLTDILQCNSLSKFLQRVSFDAGNVEQSAIG